MEHTKFLKLSLLSSKEQSALQVDLSTPVTVLVAGNGYGKSAILKSLYDALGAKPHKIDRPWRDASVTTLLEFTVEDVPFAALKTAEKVTILDRDKHVLLSTSRVTAELGPYLADLFAFRLVLANKKEEIKTPPPSYIFAPYYVDQDRSWQKPWDSFSDLRMYPKSSKPLADYHSGLRPNAYYEAKAERDRLKTELTRIVAERSAVDQASRRIASSMAGVPITVDLNEFRREMETLVKESQRLYDAQTQYRNELAPLNEEHNLWIEHVGVVEGALREIDDSFIQALSEAPAVECPMCGQNYENHIADQFELVADKDDLVHALHVGRQKTKELAGKLEAQKGKIDKIVAAIEGVDAVLKVRRREISLHDVVAAKGRSEAQRVLVEQLAVLDADAGEKQRLISDAERRMQQTESKTRRQTILTYFNDTLARFATDLDVKLPEKMRDPIQGLQIGRGSEGPRALAAYYYAFLWTAREYGSSTFCPIVIDAPNQQGQDKGHLEQIMQFLLRKAPRDAQVIVGAEALSDAQGAKVIDVSHKRDQVLRRDQHKTVMEYLRPFLTQAIL